MQKFWTIILGGIFGLAPLAGTTIISLAMYVSFPSTAVTLGIAFSVVLSLWLGLKIFKRVQIVGPIEFLTAIHASPDLDHLEPTENSKTKRRSPEALVELLKNKKQLFQGGTIRIYGDWFGKPYGNYHEINSATYDQIEKLLTLYFKEGEKLQIYNPKHLFEARTFLKIIQADSIKMTWFYKGSTHSEAKQYYIDYGNENKKITTKTNVDYYKPILDIALGDPALMIYG